MVTGGDPRASACELYRDDLVECGVWEVTPGEFAGANAGFGEHMYVLYGEATVTSEDGATVELRPGVTFVARAGWRGRWEVRETVRRSMSYGRCRDDIQTRNQLAVHRAGFGAVVTALLLAALGP